ncbi:MAG: hypothetical protein JRH16_02030 [Deltaproteobacteria bacterium]|nr:hypothetical protein [Deltaproteobacteria bacterium]MBW2359321.1 hypothetical protein [Deltaproteobacteria bacterium]
MNARVHLIPLVRAGMPAYRLTSVIHTPPEGLGKTTSELEPRMALACQFTAQTALE